MWGEKGRKNSAKKYQLNDFHIIVAIYNTEDFIFDELKHKKNDEHKRQEHTLMDAK